MELAQRTGMMTFPQVIIDGELVGGFTEVQAAAESRAPGRATARAQPAQSASHASAFAPRSRLAGLADVGPAPGDDHLHDRRPARPARLALAPVDEELVLEGSAHAVDVAEVVDRRPARVDAGLQRRDRRLAQALVLLGRELPGGAQRVDAGAEQRLVGVDVPDAGDAPLVEQERLDRRRPPRACARRCSAVNSSSSGSRPRRAAKNASSASSPSSSSPVPKRRGSTIASAPARGPGRSARGVCGGSGSGSQRTAPVMRRCWTR